MKKALLVMALLCVLGCLYAEESVAVDFSGMDSQEKAAFMFFYGYEAIMEKACKGAFLALDQESNFIGGWQTDQTPEDFCTNLPAGVIATSLVLQTDLAKAMFYLLEDKETVAKLDGMACSWVYVVCVFLPYEGMELQEPVYSCGKRLLEDEAVRHGLNPEEFFAFMQAQGISEESLVYTMYNGIASSSEIVLDALGMMQTKKESAVANMKDVLIYMCLGCVGLIVIAGVFLAIHGLVVKKKLSQADRQAKIEKHNKEVDS